MDPAFPTSYEEIKNWSWSQIEPYYQELVNRSITVENAHTWLADWSRIKSLLEETYWRLYVNITANTTDEEAKQRYTAYLDDIFPNARAVEQKLKEKLLDSGIEPQGFEIPLRNLRAEARLFRPENLPLLSEELKLNTEYDEIIGAQTVEWEGQELTIAQLLPISLSPDRDRREKAWLAGADRQLADRETINDLWTRFMALRGRIAANAGLPDYRAYRWVQRLRFDYTPQDCYKFHQAIEEVAVPAAQRIYEKRRQNLGVETLRPWDLAVDPLGREPLSPFRTIAELEDKCQAIFSRVDPQLGEYFETMRREGLLDLDNRKGKAPGGYCTQFYAAKRPFIFANSVGLHEDVQTLLHEGGHAFHVFETRHLPYYHQLEIPYEFLEVASMGIEYLAGPYLGLEWGGFYSNQDAARARSEYLEQNILFWPYMAVVDAFQHWVYENHAAASDPANCDAKWTELWARFMPGVDWDGMEQVLRTGWQRKLHIHQEPFYYIEYGLAQLGAGQVWENSLRDPVQAVAAYRRALSLGGTAALPELYAAAGAKFAFDAPTLRAVVALIEDTL